MLNRERNLLLKEQAIKESERQHELNVLKTNFFTNVSHEFRTPLTLILTPLQSILKSDLDWNTKKHLELVYHNANRLMILVNQLLDFRKAEEKKLQLNLIYGDIIKHIQNTIDSFSDLAISKKIDLKFLSFESELFMRFDSDKMEKIITNLLSNAFKFSAANGSITVSTKLTSDDMIDMLEIKVEDKGIGIKQEEREKLFERFYQADLPAELISSGSGIGLSLAKEFVEMHHGIITVDSEPGIGSCFTILLPVNRQRLISDMQNESEIHKTVESYTEAESILKPEIDTEKKTILLVEDNDEFRGYLKDCLMEEYNIMVAENGKFALELLEIEDADLIISDIMMPVMDGIQLCNVIKTDAKFSHIPLIMLTAKSTHQDRIAGLKMGADEYIAKPFNLDILKSRIVYLMGLREKFVKEYQKTFKVETNIETITTIDQKLLNQTLDLINKNMMDSEFNVEKLSAELGISRVYLYKKLSSLTGKTPVELIRSVKLRKAAELLIKSQLSVSEIAYEVGFNDPRYFSKQFKNEFNMLPTTYRETAG
jgi:DNA-binding response OmpR family regulator/nitrogen-specific signal transduction histidine kinase